MVRKDRSCKNKLRELEITLEEERSLSRARNALLEANIKELDEIYRVLDEKLRSLRSKDERIRDFDARLVRASKLSALGELAGSIAHEIATPLIAIQGFARRIKNSNHPEKTESYAGLIEEESGRLAKVLAKLLDFSRMDESKKERVEVAQLVSDTVIFMEYHFTRFKNVNIRIKRSKKPAFVEIDKIQVQQVIVNLMNNAAQAMPKGGTILIRSGIRKGYAYIAVTDQGEGIDADIMDKIFDPFFTTKPRGEGTGLGLSLSKRFIEANNGRIEVAAEKGKGSTFTLLLPLVPNPV